METLLEVLALIAVNLVFIGWALASRRYERLFGRVWFGEGWARRNARSSVLVAAIATVVTVGICAHLIVKAAS